MIELELFLILVVIFLILVVNILTLYVVNKKTTDPSFNLQDKTKEEIKVMEKTKLFKKAWGKNKKYKPYVNDDHTAWMKENSKA